MTEYEKQARELLNCSDETRAQSVRSYFVSVEQIASALRSAAAKAREEEREVIANWCRNNMGEVGLTHLLLFIRARGAKP